MASCFPIKYISKREKDVSRLRKVGECKGFPPKRKEQNL